MQGADADGLETSAREAGHTAQPLDGPPLSLRELLHATTHHSTGLLYANSRSAYENLRILELAARSGANVPGGAYHVPVNFSPALIAPQSDVPDSMLSLLTALNAFKRSF